MKLFRSFIMMLLFLIIVGCSESEDHIAKLNDMHSMNKDAVMWLTLDGCDIDEPVFHSVDNFKYYYTDKEGNENEYGSLFLDCRNQIHENMLLHNVNTIYGYSDIDDNSGPLFSSLNRYNDEIFALKNQIIKLTFMDKETEWVIFAAGEISKSYNYTDPNMDMVYYQELLEHLINCSYIDFGIDLTIDDKIIILSTNTDKPNFNYFVAAVSTE